MNHVDSHERGTAMKVPGRKSIVRTAMAFKAELSRFAAAASSRESAASSLESSASFDSVGHLVEPDNCTPKVREAQK